MLDAERLTALRFVEGLPPQALNEVAALCNVRTVPAGTVLFREGSRCSDLFLVESGHVALDMNVPGHGAVRILSIGAGELLGWSALLGDGPMTATATAQDDVTAIVIPGKELRQLCDSRPEIGYPVMRQTAVALSRRLVVTRLQLLDLFGPGTGDRVR